MDDFNVVVPIEVTFRDTDAMGHANNAVYLTWFENGRFGYWRAMLGQDADYGEVPFVLGRAEVDYRTPAYVGEQLRLGVRLSRIGARSFDLVYRLERTDDGGIVAEGKTIQVMYDYTTAASMPMPDDFRARLVEIDGDPSATAAG